MKKIFVYLSIVLVLGITPAISQSDIAGPFGHAGVLPAWYVGWDASPASNAIPLSIEHRGTANINFLTGGIQRMTILGTLVPATAGYVGIRTAAPIFPLDVQADGANFVTTSGWKAGIHLSNHAALAWDNDGFGN